MKLARYLKDRAFVLPATLLVLLFIAVMFAAFGVDLTVAIYTDIMVSLVLVIVLSIDFLRRRRFYTQLAVVLEQLPEKQLISELLYRPSFLEGELAFDALKAGNKSMNDSIAAQRRTTDEYREYLESWVHEIKAPIASVGLIVENHRGELDGSLASALTAELGRIESYVEQALYYTRSAHVERDYAIRRVPLAELVKAAVRKQSRVLIESGITPQLVELDFDVLVDSKWLDFILGQIITNSAKYTTSSSGDPSCFERPTITFTAQHLDADTSQERVILSIIDNGIGIPASDVARVFDKGFTGANGRTHTHSTGIGLYLCKRLCEKMGLSITIASKEGAGTTVNIIFPLSELHLLEH
jgi:signal transduction histidine kinase